MLWVKLHCINKFSDVRFECIEHKINPRETINPINLKLEPNTRLNKKFILSGLEIIIIIIIINEPHFISVAVPQDFSDSRIVPYKTSSSIPTFVVPLRELALSQSLSTADCERAGGLKRSPKRSVLVRPATPEMESDPSSVFRHKKTPSSDRLLGLFSEPASISTVGSELQENDILWSSADEDRSTPPLPIRAAPFRTISAVGFPTPETSGILAALSETRPDPDRRFVHRRASISPPASSKITIPSFPKPPSPRDHPAHQSAPVNVPVRIPAASSGGRRRSPADFPEEAEDEEADDKMLPPHEIVARSSARGGSPMTTFSMLEGKGRTLKGRDLRRVRNAVFRQTGFLD